MIEIGEYVRTKKGEIMKVTSIPVEVDGKITYQTDKGWVELECDIVKHSENIIDLIEEGDFVNKELVYQCNNKEKTKYLQPNDVDGSVYYLEDFIKREGLSKILTHEQYEQNCYRLEG